MKIVLCNIYGQELAIEEVNKNYITGADIPDTWELSEGDVIKIKHMQKYVETNKGIIPLEDYYEIMSYQHGFSSYSELRANGLYIDVPEDKIIEK